MQLIAVNPTRRPKKRAASPKRGGTMKRRKSARSVTKKHRNPTRRRRAVSRRTMAVNPVRRRRRTHRNPSVRGLFGSGSVLKELISAEGAMMVGAAFAAPLAVDYLQEKLMPSATGLTKIGVKAAILAGGTWAISKFLKKNKLALAFGVTGAAVLAADLVTYYKNESGSTVDGLSSAQAQALANNPNNAQVLAAMGYPQGLGDSFTNLGLAENALMAYPVAFRNQFM